MLCFGTTSRSTTQPWPEFRASAVAAPHGVISVSGSEVA